MILVFAIVIAMGGSIGVLLVSLLGYFLTRWLGTPASIVVAGLLTIAILLDVWMIVVMFRDVTNADSRVVAQILAAGYAVPLLVAVPCVGYFVWRAIRG